MRPASQTHQITLRGLSARPSTVIPTGNNARSTDDRSTPLTRNPARELAETLESWAVDDQGRSITAIRATAIGAQPYDDAFWADSDRAVALLGEYRRIVDTLPDEEEADYHRSQFRTLHHLVYAPDAAWGSTAGRAVNGSDIDKTITTLRLAARALDHVAPADLNQSQGNAIVGLLQQALELTDEVPAGIELDHLRRTIGLAIQFAGDLDRYSTDAARAVAAEVVSDLRTLAEDDEIDPETRSNFGRIWRDLLLQLGINMMAAYGVTGLNAGGEAVIRSITG